MVPRGGGGGAGGVGRNALRALLSVESRYETQGGSNSCTTAPESREQGILAVGDVPDVPYHVVQSQG